MIRLIALFTSLRSVRLFHFLLGVVLYSTDLTYSSESAADVKATDDLLKVSTFKVKELSEGDFISVVDICYALQILTFGSSTINGQYVCMSGT